MTDVRKLLDSWSPPAHAGQALGCLATTFTFEPDFFEQQCLGRFLSLDAMPEEGPALMWLVEREEKPPETPVCVIADRSAQPDGGSLRWHLLPAAVSTGILHSKVALLVWERCVRVIISSANLVEDGYRRNIELGFVLELGAEGATAPIEAFGDALTAIERIIALVPAHAGAGASRQRGGHRGNGPRAARAARPGNASAAARAGRAHRRPRGRERCA